MKARYGCEGGGEEFFIVVDTDLCDACGDCVGACPANVFETIGEDGDEMVAAVAEARRHDLKDACGPCKPVTDRPPLPCVSVCGPGAIEHSW